MSDVATVAKFVRELDKVIQILRDHEEVQTEEEVQAWKQRARVAIERREEAIREWDAGLPKRMAQTDYERKQERMIAREIFQRRALPTKPRRGDEQ